MSEIACVAGSRAFYVKPNRACHEGYVWKWYNNRIVCWGNFFTLLSWGKKISSTKHVELTLEGCRCFEAQFSLSHSLSLPHSKTIKGEIIWLHPTWDKWEPAWNNWIPIPSSINRTDLNRKLHSLLCEIFPLIPKSSLKARSSGHFGRKHGLTSDVEPVQLWLLELKQDRLRTRSTFEPQVFEQGDHGPHSVNPSVEFVVGLTAKHNDSGKWVLEFVQACFLIQYTDIYTQMLGKPWKVPIDWAERQGISHPRQKTV